MPPTPPTRPTRSTRSSGPPGLPLADLVGSLGAGLLSVVVAAAGPEQPAEVDDVTFAEPGAGIHGQPGDLVLGVAVESTEAAADLVRAAAEAGSAGVVLRRDLARRRQVRSAARSGGVTLVELAEHASWAHLVWLIRGVLDRAATGVAQLDAPVHDELFALADACAALVDAPVTIEDTQSRVVAHSARQDVADPVRLSTIVGRKVPDQVIASLRARGVFRRLARSADPVFVPADRDLKPRLVVPVRAGDEWLGSIWAVVEERPPAEVVRSLTQTASVVALHLLRLRSQADLARRMAADRIRELLTGQAVDADSWLPAPPWRVVVLGGGPGDDVRTRLELWESAARRAGWRTPLLATLDDHTLAIVREVPDDPAPGTWQWLRSLIADVAQTTPEAHADAGRAADRAPDLPRSLREALEVHRLRAAGHLTERVATLADAWAQVTCERAVSGIRTHDLLGPVVELTAHDEDQGTEYARTLAAWLDQPGAPRAAAHTLHVHPNTLRYRMARLADVVDVDLEDPTTRLALRLQLRALGHRPQTV